MFRCMQVYSECPVYDELIPALLKVAAGELPMQVRYCMLLMLAGMHLSLEVCA